MFLLYSLHFPSKTSIIIIIERARCNQIISAQEINFIASAVCGQGVALHLNAATITRDHAFRFMK